jgi:hypothetical protein
MDRDVCNLNSEEAIRNLPTNEGFSGDAKVISRTRGALVFHCLAAGKKRAIKTNMEK